MRWCSTAGATGCLCSAAVLVNSRLGLERNLILVRTAQFGNDLWAYDCSSGLWRWLGGSTADNLSSNYGTIGIMVRE